SPVAARWRWARAYTDASVDDGALYTLPPPDLPHRGLGELWVHVLLDVRHRPLERALARVEGRRVLQVVHVDLPGQVHELRRVALPYPGVLDRQRLHQLFDRRLAVLLQVEGVVVVAHPLEIGDHESSGNVGLLCRELRRV